MDIPYECLPPPVNQLIATVRAPASALSPADGQIRPNGMDGLFVSDVRVITEARLSFGGVEPYPLAQLHEGPGRSRFVSFARGFGDPISDPTVRIDRIRTVLPDGMSEEIQISSVATRPVRARLELDLRCDLTPLELAKAGKSRPDVAATLDGGALVWRTEEALVEAYSSSAEVCVDPPRLTWPVEMMPGERRAMTWSVRVRERKPFLAAPTGPIEWMRPRVRCDDSRLVRLVTRALDDLECLRLTEAPDDAHGQMGAEGEQTFLGAGAPWFLTLFGRDSIWAARMLLPLGTALAEGTLRTLARRQGSRVDHVSGEAPGKIMHELRRGDQRIHGVGRTGGSASPVAYYGTVDATLLWISLLADAWRWGMSEATVADLLPNLRRALSWLSEYGDPDGDGFIEYIDVAGQGLANQGWKDSFDAIRFHDGTLGRPPIALCEVQGYAYRAALDAAELLDAFDPGSGEGDRWRTYAEKLADRFRARFWVDGPLGPFPALAIDGDDRAVDSLTSNIGHLLGTGLLNRDEEATVARLLGTPAMSDGYGLRTMSTLDDAFSPLSYHCGSIWPHDTAIVLLGLAQVGADSAAADLVSGLLAAAEAFDYRLPELYSGDARSDTDRPIPHPSACRPQAWSAATAVAIVHASLGLSVHVPKGEVRVRPMRGLGLGAMEVGGLRISESSVDVAVDRDGTVQVSGLPANLRFIHQMPGTSPPANG